MFNIESIETFEKRLKTRGGTYLGHGRHRMGFKRGKVVYKIPRNPEGIKANKREADMYKEYGQGQYDDGAEFARCRLLKNDVLVMEHVVRLECNEVAPGWVHDWDWHEGPQVGRNKKGRVVLYDYAE